MTTASKRLRDHIASRLRQWADVATAADSSQQRHARLLRQMGINDGQPLRVIKQYGEYRTGSNALRALLLENFDNALVLMHVLGDKHHDAADFTALAHALSHPGADPCRTILHASWSRPGGVTRPEGFAQLAFVRAFTPAIAASITSGDLRIVLSVRHPLTWIEAVMRFWEWPTSSTGDTWLDTEAVNLATGLCRRYNARHLGWSQLLDASGDRARVVRFEDLESNARKVAEDLASALPLHLRHGHPVNSGRKVAPSPWDNVPPCYLKQKRGTRALNRKPARRELQEIVINEIDWRPLARFGYEPALDASARSAAVGTGLRNGEAR